MSGIDVGVSLDADANAGRDNALLDILGKIHIGVNNLTAELQQSFLKEQARLSTQPRAISLERSSQPSGTFDLIDFGGPQPGREWVLRLLTAFAQPLAANVAVVTWYVGQRMPGPANGMLPVTMAKWQFPSCPGQATFGANMITIRNGQNLIAGLTGVPASSTIALVAGVSDQPAFGAQAVYSQLD
jgi:hypothetical protein